MRKCSWCFFSSLISPWIACKKGRLHLHKPVNLVRTAAPFLGQTTCLVEIEGCVPNTGLQFALKGLREMSPKRVEQKGLTKMSPERVEQKGLTKMSPKRVEQSEGIRPKAALAVFLL